LWIPEKPAVAGRRNMSCRARVGWLKRKLFRKIGTQEYCGPRKELAAAGIKMTHCTRVAWRKRKLFRKIVDRGVN
jgi:hypothetical protein